MKYIFLDTNIFLHFQDFEKIDWLSESSSKTCKLVISPVVIDELDEKKNRHQQNWESCKKCAQSI